MMQMSDITITQFLIFTRTKDIRKVTYDVTVKNKSCEELGKIAWRTGWRRYVFKMNVKADYDSRCLKDIAEYLDQLMEEHKDEK